MTQQKGLIMSAKLSSRRRFLQRAGGVALGTAGGAALAGCTSDSPPPTRSSGSTGTEPSSSSTTGVALPTYAKLTPAEPDLPGDASGVPDAFFTFPKSPLATVDGVPGTGGTVTSMVAMYGAAIPPSPDRNDWWKGLNERLGVELDISMTAQDYEAKIATTIAGDDIPDLVHIPTATPRLPEVLEAKFEDLTEYLSGDAVLDYPNLASLPGYMWETAIHGGAIRAIPPGNIVGQPTWTVRTDVLDSLGADLASATDADRVLDLFTEVTDAARNNYAITTASIVFNLLTTMYSTPFEWAESGGRFTHAYETDEFRAALEFGTRLWASGVMHPDTFGGANGPELFRGGKLPFFAWGGVGYRSLLRTGIPGLELGFWAPPKAEGGGVGPKRLGTGVFQQCAIRKQDSPDRVRELLRILNYFATPFGSQEYLYLKFGTEGTHWKWNEDLQAPVGNQKISDERINVSYFASAPYELFDPGDQDVTAAMHEHQVATIPSGMRNASTGLYSATAEKQWSTLKANADDVANNVLQERATLADWDAAVDEWRATGGDAVRGEYEQAFAELHG